MSSCAHGLSLETRFRTVSTRDWCYAVSLLTDSLSGQSLALGEGADERGARVRATMAAAWSNPRGLLDFLCSSTAPLFACGVIFVGDKCDVC